MSSVCKRAYIIYWIIVHTCIGDLIDTQFNGASCSHILDIPTMILESLSCCFRLKAHCSSSYTDHLEEEEEEGKNPQVV